MPTLNQTLTRSESDLLISIGVVLGTIALQPVNAAFERLTQLAGRCNFQTSPATSDLRIQLSQAQLGQAFFMIDDAATFAHNRMAKTTSVLVQLL